MSAAGEDKPTGAAVTPELVEEAAPRGRSLLADAWRRLLKNRMAVAGMIVVAIMSLVSALAPWIVPFDPEAQEPWAGARPPSFAHPDVLRRTRFEVGSPAPLPARVAERVRDALRATAESELVLAVREGASQLIDISVEGGAISSLRRRQGAVGIPVIITDEDISLETVEGDPLDLPGLAPGDAVPGALVPRGRDPSGRFQVTCVMVERRAIREVRVRLSAEGADAGVTVHALEVDGTARPHFIVSGRDVVSVRVGGEAVTHAHVLGTDLLGRDTLSRVIYGGRISLLIGILATLVTVTVGVVYGAVAGYFGGRVDQVLMRIVDILYALPYMFLVILLLVFFGRDIIMLFIALGAVQWLTMAQIVRGQVLSLKQKEFVDAARVSGASSAAIIFRHLIPNTLGVVAVYATLTVPAVILQESFLSFIGLTVTYEGQSLESWGALMDYGRQALLSDGDRWWLLVFPSLAMAATLFSLNFLGDGLRDALDPRMRGRT